MSGGLFGYTSYYPETTYKPEEQIKDLMASGKVKLRTFLDSIKSKEQAVNGRINIDTIILKITR